MIAILQQSLQLIYFIPIEVNNNIKYVNGVFIYILHITSSLINKQKAVINIIDIKSFFNVEIPEEMLLSIFKIKLIKILFNILNSTSKFEI